MGNIQSNSTPQASGMSGIPTVTGDCIICTEENVQLLKLPCGGHSGYCSDCHTNELINLQEDSHRPSCPVCDTEISLQTLQPFISAELYEKMNNKINIEWATPSAERLYCANTDCVSFIPPSAPLSSKGGRQCHSCSEFTCIKCKKLAHGGDCAEDKELEEAIRTAEKNGGKRCPKCKVICYRDGGCQHMYREHFGCDHEWCFLCERNWDECEGSCEASHADAERVQDEIDEEEQAQLDAVANAAFELAGRPLARQVLAGSHVYFIMRREYMARLGVTALDDVLGTIAVGLDGINNINDPIPPRSLLAFTHVGRQLMTREFATINMPFGDAYNENQDLIDTLFNRFRRYRSQAFVDYEVEATRQLFVIYGDDGPDANELRDQIRERLASFNTAERNVFQTR